MTLLAPALLAGLLGLALPLIAHRHGRQPPKQIRFAAVRFLPVVDPTVTQRHRLRDLPLLLVRLALLAVLVGVLVRPATFEQADMTVVAQPHDAVLVVDGSMSMQLEVDRQSLLEHAIERVDTLLAALPSGTRIGLVTSDPLGPVVDLTDDYDRIRSALWAWQKDDAPRPGSWPLRDALDDAASLLDAIHKEREQVVYAIADATERGLGSLPQTAPGGRSIVPIEAIARDLALPEHVGLSAIAWEPAPELDPRAVRVRAIVHRYRGSEDEGDRQPRTITAALLIGVHEVTRATVEVAPGEQAPIEFTHTLLADAREAATIAIVDPRSDPLPADDRGYLWLSVDYSMEIAVVNGDPSELRAHDEVFFLTTALGATDLAERIRVRSIAPDQLEQALRSDQGESLAQTDVLVLANVRAPSEDIAPTIVERVKAGMGLWITVGDRVEVESYNARLGELLPLRFREIVRVGTAPGRTEARVEGIAPANLAHPAFRGLPGDLNVSATRARKIALLEPDPKSPSEVALAYTNGAPALITTTVGNGRIALLTTTIDRDWADLALRPGFVPLVATLLPYLAGQRRTDTLESIEPGVPWPIRSESAATIETPSGREVASAPDKDAQILFRDTSEVGHYLVRGESTDGAFVVNVSAEESITDRVEVAVAQADGNDGQQAVVTSVPRWRLLALLGALVLLLESGFRLWALRRRR